MDVRNGSSRVELVGNELPGHRLWLTDTVDVLVEGNHIHDIPVGNSGGRIGVRLLRDVRPVVRGNRIENLVEDPIQAAEVDRGLIEGNVLRNAHPVSGQHTDAIQVLGANGLTIRGNFARDIEVQFRGAHPNAVVRNNIFEKVSGLADQKPPLFGVGSAHQRPLGRQNVRGAPQHGRTEGSRRAPR